VLSAFGGTGKIKEKSKRIRAKAEDLATRSQFIG